jgi:hypothetical protein
MEFSVYTACRTEISSVRTFLLGGGLENLLLVRSRANVPDKGTRGSLHSHNFKKVDESVTKSLDSWRTQYLISGTGLVGAFRLRRPHRCAVRILWVYHPRHSFSGKNPNRKSFNIIDSIPLFVSRVMAEAIASYA